MRPSNPPRSFNHAAMRRFLTRGLPAVWHHRTTGDTRTVHIVDRTFGEDGEAPPTPQNYTLSRTPEPAGKNCLVCDAVDTASIPLKFDDHDPETADREADGDLPDSINLCPKHVKLLLFRLLSSASLTKRTNILLDLYALRRNGGESAAKENL